MAVADYDDFRAKLASPYQRIPFTKNALTTVQAKHMSWWTFGPHGGVAPTTAVAPTMATAGALGQESVRLANPSADAFVGEITLKGGDMIGALILCDRLSHQGGLDATVTTAGVTTNLPTAALTRYTSGVGVMAAVEVYTIIGTTATTITCAYTNQNGDAKTSQPIVIGGTANREAGRLHPINLEAGDSGVRSIESSTLLATTGTAGAFGYTLFKPLVTVYNFREYTTVQNGLFGGGGFMPEVVDNACLFWVYLGTATSLLPQGIVTLIEA